MKIRGFLAIAATVGLLLTGCSSTPSGNAGPSPKKINVIVAFYPLQFASESVAGDRATVTNLVTPGTEPHDLELTPKQIGALASADLVVYLKGFQPQLDAAIEQQRPRNVIEVASVATMRKAGDHEHETTATPDPQGHSTFDPHLWLDPTNMIKVAAAIETRLAEIDAGGKDVYLANLAKTNTQLTTLDEQFKSGLASCKVKEIITTHEAFGYLTARYGLTQLGINGLSPDAEPSPARIAEVHRLAKNHSVTTIFYETLTSPNVAKSIAGDLGLKTDVLDPVEGVTKDSRGTNYVEVMQSNLQALRTANDCN